MTFITRNGHPAAQKSRPDPGDGHKRPIPLGIDIQTGREVTLPLNERAQGQYVIGSTGTGKTTLLLNMILADIRAGHGLALVEPHTDLVRAVISGIPDYRLRDVIYLNLADSVEAPVGINLFECPQPRTLKNIAATSSFVSHVFEKVWGAQTETTPRLMMVLRAITRTLIENSPSGATFTEIPHLLHHPGIRAKMVESLSTSSSIASFWEDYNHRTQRERDELTASTLNKVVSFLDQDMIRNIVGQSKTTLDFRRIMDSGQILLVSLSPQYEEASRLLGSVIIGRLLMAAFSRTDTPEAQRKFFLLYCDEYQRFATADFATLLAEARKFRIITVLSNQALQMLDDINRAAALQAGILAAFRVSGEDSKLLAASFDTSPTNTIVGEEPVRAPVADPLAHLVRHGHPHPAVSKLVTEYLVPLEALSRHMTSSLGRPLGIGPLSIRQLHVSEARGLLTRTLATCMQTGKADLFLDPMILFILGAAAGTGIPWVFDGYYKWNFFELGEFIGFRKSARQFGEATFLENKAAVKALAQRRAKQTVYSASAGHNIRQTPGPSFIEMLTCLRQSMAILAKEPLMTDTGLFQPKYQLRSYQDQENLVANELSQLPNFHAKVRLLSGEHTIRTHPAPLQLGETEIDERVRVIKKRMLFFGMTKPYAAVEAEIRKRQSLLRQQADADIPVPPSPPTNGRRRRKPAPRPSTGVS